MPKDHQDLLPYHDILGLAIVDLWDSRNSKDDSVGEDLKRVHDGMS